MTGEEPGLRVVVVVVVIVEKPSPLSISSRGVSISLLQCERELVDDTPDELRMLLMLSELKEQANRTKQKIKNNSKEALKGLLFKQFNLFYLIIIDWRRY